MPGEIRVLFFATARQAAGWAESVLPCDDSGLSVADFWDRLQTENPGLTPLRSSVRLARNHEYLTGDEWIHPGDEIALIPPVSGG